MNDLDDLLDGPASKPKRGRPTKEMLAERAARTAEELTRQRARAKAIAATTPDTRIDLPDPAMFYRPVGVKFLADVFRMEQRTVLKKLMKCPVVEFAAGLGTKGRKVPKWDFVVAASYLVPPKIDLRDYIASLNANNIPPVLNKIFWDAQNARSKWEANARHTWHDEDVLAVLGDTAMHIREVTMLWLEELPGRVNMTTEDDAALRAQIADLLEQIKERLVDLPAKRRTEGVITRMDDMLAAEVGQTIEGQLIDEADMDELLD